MIYFYCGSGCVSEGLLWRQPVVTDPALLPLLVRNRCRTLGPSLPHWGPRLLPAGGTRPASERPPGGTSAPRCGRGPGSGPALGVGRRRSGVPWETPGEEPQGRACVHTR